MKTEKNKNRRTKIIGQRLPKPNLLKLGDVVAVPLANSYYGYARRFVAALGLLDIPPTKGLLNLDRIKSASAKVFRFTEYYEPTDHPEWIFLGNWPFATLKDGESPPVVVLDKCNPNRYQLLINGRLIECSKQQTLGLQIHGLKRPETIRAIIEEHMRQSEPL